MNTVTLTARLTADPELRQAGEHDVATLRVAAQRRRGRDGEDRGAVYIDVEAWDAQARTAAEYLAKGRHVAITGRLELDEWKADDGTRRQRHKIVARDVEFLDRPRDDAAPEPATDMRTSSSNPRAHAGAPQRAPALGATARGSLSVERLQIEY